MLGLTSTLLLRLRKTAVWSFCQTLQVTLGFDVQQCAASLAGKPNSLRCLHAVYFAFKLHVGFVAHTH